MKHLCLAAVLTAAALPAAAAPLGPFSDFLVFGDSVSDPGNAFQATGGSIPDPTYYPNGQFTDGDTWATQLGASRASGMNFAFGGARGTADPADPIPDFGEQIAGFAALGRTLGAHPLAAVWFGGNDLRDAFGAADPAAATPAAIASTVAAIVTGVQTLVSSGLGTVAVLGLPDLGKIPEVLARGSAASAAATGATVAFNATLQSALAGVSGGNARYVDIFGLFQAVQADPAAYRLTDLDTPCIADLVAGTVADCSGYLFFDTIHPTEQAHRLIANRFVATIAPVPLPAGLPLLATGLLTLALSRRRTR